MKYCTNCGNELREGANFCPKCGTRVDDKKVEPKEKLKEESKDTEEPKEELKEESKEGSEEKVKHVVVQKDSECANCGYELIKGAKICPKCGTRVDDKKVEPKEELKDTEETKEESKEKVKHAVIQKDSKCPYCGSENTKAVSTQRRVRVGHFSIKSAAVTGVCCCLGPLGLLAGILGGDPEIIPESEWCCEKCGKHHLSFDSAIKRMEYHLKAESAGYLVFGIVLSFIYFTIFNVSTVSMVMSIPFAAIYVAVDLFIMSVHIEVLNKDLGYCFWDNLEIEQQEKFKKKIGWNVAKFVIAFVIFTVVVIL